MRPASPRWCGLESDGSQAGGVDCLAVTSEPNQPKAADDLGTAGGGGMALFYVVALALSILVGAAVAIPEYLPTNDGPQGVFSSHAARHLGDASVGYGRFFKPGAVLAQFGFDQLFSFWERFLSWRPALRVSLVNMTLLWAWGVVALAGAFGGRRRIWLGVFGFAAAVQWQVYMGFFSYYVATGFGFYVIAVAAWRPKWNLVWRTTLAAGLACQALLHPVPAVTCGLVVVAIALWRTPAGSWLRESARLALMVTPAALVVLAGIGAGDPRPDYWNLPLLARAGLAVSAFVSGPPWRSWGLPVAALAAAAFAVVARAWRQDRCAGALLMSGLAFALVAVLAPFHLPGWQFFNMRFSPLAAVLLVLLLPVEQWSLGLRRAGLGLLVIYAVASNLWALGYNLRLQEASRDLLAGLEAPLRRDGMRLPLILEPRAGEPQDKAARTIPYATANWNMGALFAVEQGGVPAWVFADIPSVHALLWRWPEQQGLRPPRPERGFEWWLSEPEVANVPGARKAAVSHLLSYAPYYQDVIFYGRPEEVGWLRERGFIIDFERAGLAIARFHACPADLEIAPGPRGHSATILQFGWSPAAEPTFSATLPAQPDSQEARHWSVPECPCGDVWFRVLFDNDGDGRLSAGDDLCMEARPDGMVAARIAAGGARVPCHPGQSVKLPARARP